MSIPASSNSCKILYFWITTLKLSVWASLRSTILRDRSIESNRTVICESDHDGCQGKGEKITGLIDISNLINRVRILHTSI